MQVRTETRTDHDAVREVLIDAFDGPDEALLVDLIRRSDRFVPELSIVAEVDGTVVGHILFSYVDLVADRTRRVLSLAPLAVATTNTRDSRPESVNDGKRDQESHRWITGEGAGSWIRLDWNDRQEVNKIRLWDLPETDSWILQGTFTFSDGSTEKLHAWTSNRAYAPSEISFETKSISWVKFTIDQASGSTLGLGELEVYAPE